MQSNPGEVIKTLQLHGMASIGGAVAHMYMQCIGYISQKLNVVTSKIFIARITRLCGPDFLFLSLSDHKSISEHKNSNCSEKISSQVKEAPKKKYTMESTDPRQLREARE